MNRGIETPFDGSATWKKISSGASETLDEGSERNLIERFFSKLKHFRRVATRYDKLAANLLAMVQLASMRLWLRINESTA